MASGSTAARDQSQARALDVSGGPVRVAGTPFVHAGVTGTARERIPTVIIDEHGAMARAVAGRIATLIRERASAARPLVLGLATGSTPIGVYRELIRLHREDGVSFRHVITFNLDEYYPMRRDSIHSYHRFMWENLFSHVDIDPAHVHIPDGSLPRADVEAACAAYEQRIADVGGIDFQLLGIGKTGHIGFNEPGSGEQSHTRLVHLDSITRRDAAADFFGEENVPREAITMGIATIMGAREIAILATGEHKAGIVRRAVEGEIDRAVAATFLQRHPNTTFYVDDSAAADLTRVATPWLLDEVHWGDALMLRAVTWLAAKCGKAILKLTQQDYADNHLTSLVARHGSPGAVNGLVFNMLGAKIRGKSKLPRGLRTICFSPHPDDDVISMGGILRKFVENGNDMTVAYMTSGNIAVFDHDVRRYLDFLVRLDAERIGGGSSVRALADTVHAFLDRKQPGEVDIAEVQDIKRIIRESEAVSGIEVMGLSKAHARFLNLPFYQTGKVRKDPIGPADVAIVAQLLREIQPDLIFVAGDLSDPHGTHRMCKEAIDRAVAEVYTGAQAAARPEIWLYRGAWQEWPVTEATVLVPLSQEELTLKIQAIFKHQSQKDSAPFPGQDEREFWQRVEQRNKTTARQLDQLGLAEYFAMEAYVIA
ncbi:MAG: glucosamine-6-phosphate deaminase [Gemmatimonas sp.]|jgi:glucosamine-6-phosphate deaminase|uniref:glucosamine-6-phosphate deaminase n=1 Tax=Gemmatimonas sp. TaxID=1962908 RepID=UPI0022BB64A9|nr:glucosamine-6-phosphate deaminase [Gemmatimonas sp.]MCE2954080.1 glucosamine-6-phosphate deaminase [Gemmatimonas sp.]MCZ8013380.1 glucosamine-6-phosphate deaminase [Gemmatimonas sp.]MCZ8268620.1 glucosamine-6-phosphate deaminase [Gemmatimonas sp.]